MIPRNKSKSSSTRFKRADLPEQKDERRQLILRAAEAESRRIHSVEDFTIGSLARRAGLAKGTLYLYFENKSVILMELLGSAVEEVLDDLKRRLETTAQPASPVTLANAIRDSLKKGAHSQRLSRLLKSLSENVPAEAHQRLHSRIEPRMQEIDRLFTAHGLQPQQGRRIMNYAWALLVGLTDITEQRLKRNRYLTETQQYQVPNVDDGLKEALTLLLQGALQ
jgi:AcrR family transcriptional regulator